MTNKHILIVEDDVKLAALISEFLTQHGFKVSIETQGDQAASAIEKHQPDLVILDVMLPGLDGISVCRKVRPSFKGKILMLTARSEESDEILGLEVGADDYMGKPVRPRLLLARITTLFRSHCDENQDGRNSELVEEKVSKVIEPVSVGSLSIDRQNRVVRYKDQLIDLTTAEFDLLLFLAQNAGNVLSRDDIYQGVRGIDWDGVDRSIDLRITRLRRRLKDDAKNPQVIVSVRGEGYLLKVDL